jgi:hypothetical protein
VTVGHIMLHLWREKGLPLGPNIQYNTASINHQILSIVGTCRFFSGYLSLLIILYIDRSIQTLSIQNALHRRWCRRRCSGACALAGTWRWWEEDGKICLPGVISGEGLCEISQRAQLTMTSAMTANSRVSIQIEAERE